MRWFHRTIPLSEGSGCCSSWGDQLGRMGGEFSAGRPYESSEPESRMNIGESYSIECNMEGFGRGAI